MAKLDNCGGSFRGKQNLDESGKTGLDDYNCCSRTVAICLSWLKNNITDAAHFIYKE